MASVSPCASLRLGFLIDSTRYSVERAVPAPVKSGPTLPPFPANIWHVAQPTFPKNNSRPRLLSPFTVAGFFSTLRMYVTTCQISSSVIPTPCCVAPFGGIAVPGTPLLMVLKISASASPRFFGVRVRSGPRPPPCAPRPWQKAQFARNCDSPTFAIFASLAYGFFPCAPARNADTASISDSARMAIRWRNAWILIPLTPSHNSETQAGLLPTLEPPFRRNYSIREHARDSRSHKFPATRAIARRTN